jgi:hypothetical protein
MGSEAKCLAGDLGDGEQIHVVLSLCEDLWSLFSEKQERMEVLQKKQGKGRAGMSRCTFQKQHPGCTIEP